MSDTEEHTSTDQESNVIKNTGLMTIGTLFSRFTGLFRTWAMAFALGNTMLTSAYQIAHNLPSVLYDLVAGGLLATAFLPVLLLEKEKFGKKGSDRYTSNILNITLIVLGILSLLSCVFADAVVTTQTFTVGGDAEVHQRTVQFFRIFAFQIVFYGLGGVITGVLNAGRSFFLTSIAPALNNLVVIASFIAFTFIPDQDLGIMVLAIGTTAGVAIQFLIQVPALIKTGYHWEPYLNLHDPAIKETIKIALPSLIYIVANLVAYTFRNAFSLSAVDNGPSALGYAWMWYQLPYGVVAVSISSTMFTEMSESVAKNDLAGFRSNVMRGLSATLFLIIPLSGMLFALSQPLFELFHAGAFNGADVTQVSNLLRVWVLSLPIYSVGMYMYKAFSSLRKLMSFAIINCIIVVFQLILYAVLCQPDVLGLYGVPISDMIYYTLRCIASIVLLRHYVGKSNASGVWRTTFFTCIATAVAILADLFLIHLGTPVVSLLGNAIGTIGASFIEIVICGLLGLGIAFGLTKVFKVKEIVTLQRVLSRFKRH